MVWELLSGLKFQVKRGLTNWVHVLQSHYYLGYNDVTQNIFTLIQKPDNHFYEIQNILTSNLISSLCMV